MRALDTAIRRQAPPSVAPPNLAGRVTDELQRRGAFFKARVGAGKRRLFGGDSLVSSRMAAALAAAAGFLLLVTAGLDHLTGNDWERKTEPVLADAERVLVRLVYVKPSEEARLAWAREEARKLSLSKRLAEARSGAAPVWANDLAPLETTFVLLTGGQPLPPGVVDQLRDGQLLARAVRLREGLLPGS